jgi:hypothetical protein
VGKQDKRARAARRERERQLGKLARDRERLAALAPGGAPERPIAVRSIAVIEGKATSEPCPLCGGGMELIEHAAIEREGEPLRALGLRCRGCHVSRTRYFALRPALVN